MRSNRRLYGNTNGSRFESDVESGFGFGAGRGAGGSFGSGYGGGAGSGPESGVRNSYEYCPGNVYQPPIEGGDERMGRALENAEKYRPRCDVTRESSKSENKKIKNTGRQVFQNKIEVP